MQNQYGGEAIRTYDHFIILFQYITDHIPVGKDISFLIIQGRCIAALYAIEFRTLVMGSGWNELSEVKTLGVH